MNLFSIVDRPFDCRLLLIIIIIIYVVGVQISEEAGIKDTIMTFLCHRRTKWLYLTIK